MPPATAAPTAPAPTPIAPADPEALALYVHWPFCLSKCPYCDFNSHVRGRIDEECWRRALLREIDHYAAFTRGRTLTSVFFGGGTPSLMAPETVGAVLERAAARWACVPDLEVTLEANPTSVEAGRFAGYRAAGVGRLSLGVQSLNDAELRFLGRGHSAEEARRAITLARRHFPRYSFDLIYARPGQTVAAWRIELAEAVALAAEHLSLYQLTIEPGTRFFTEHARGAFTLPEDEAAADLYEATQEALEAAGLPAYEVSNHARPGAECRHNLAYWRCGDYAGVGPGAHGRLTIGAERRAHRQECAPETWLAAVERDGHGTAAVEAIAPDERLAELLMMGLRLREGVSRAAFRRHAAGREPEEALSAAALARLQHAGLVELDAAGLRATAAGFPVLNGILAELAP
jgi:putative oxygen-independent coproporphyrinogen III oxidase